MQIEKLENLKIINKWPDLISSYSKYFNAKYGNVATFHIQSFQ